MVVMWKNPNVRMSLMVTKDIWPAIVSRLQTFDLKYENEKPVKNNDRYVRINDISGKGSDIMFFLDNLETFNAPAEDGTTHKIYVLITARRYWKNAKKVRKEAGTGSETGNGVRSGQDSESGGIRDRDVVLSSDDIRWIEVETNPSADDDCD